MTTTKNNENKKLNVPNLRFPEFEGEWEKCKLGNIANVTGGYAFKSDTLNSIGGKYQVVKMGNLYQNQLDLHRSPSYTNILTSKAENVILRKGDIAITLTGTNNKRDFGYTYIFNDEKNLLLNQRCGLIRTKGDPYFLSCLLKTYAFLNQFFESATGGTGNQANVSTKAMEMFSVNTPSLKEQKKIGVLMALLDERIATQNKIIEDLKKLKSAISENLFKAVNGDVVILSEICEIIKGKQINSEFLSEKGKYYVMNGGTEPSGYYSDYNVEANTISISEGGNSCGYVQFNTSPFWSGGHCYTIQKIADNVDHLYLYHYLKSKEDAIMKLRIGSGLPNIQKKDLAMFKIKLPTVEQQKSISTFLSSLERKAEIEEMLLNAMKKREAILAPPDVYMNIWRSRYCFCELYKSSICLSVMILLSI